MPYKCTICNADIESADKLTTTEVPGFFLDEKTGAQKEDDSILISSCESCSAKYGKPIRGVYWPRPLYEVADFEKEEKVILYGSIFRGDVGIATLCRV